ncbi:MAG: glycosyltransferase family 2 protein [Bacilli bacterium]|nr:glycosyltransferase family 2 protein [Bacilli bacterium]
MKNNIKVSIIVPVYNSEKYIKDCITSLINQTYQNIEIILVNDGSTDSSLDIIKSFKSDIIKVISQDNKGANIARKKGIDNCCGDFVMFVDSDDFISKYTVEILVDYLSKYKIDVIHFNQTNSNFELKCNNYNFLNNEEIQQVLITSKKFNSLCSALYKKSLFDDINAFDYNISYAEDYLVNLEVLSKVTSMLLIDKKMYYCTDNSESTTRSKNINRILKNFDELIFVYNKLFEYLNKWDINTTDNRKKVFNTILDVTRIFIYNILRIDDLNKKEFINIMNQYLNRDLYNKIREEFNLSDIDNSIFYKIKNINTLKNIYNKNYKKIWKIRYFLKIKDMIRG